MKKLTRLVQVEKSVIRLIIDARDAVDYPSGILNCLLYLPKRCSF